MVTFTAKYKAYETSGGAGNAIGPTAAWGGMNVFYVFNISNSSSQTISYDLNNLNNDSGNKGTVHWTSGSPSGSLSPGASVSVSCTVTSPDSDIDNNVACTMFQAGSVSLLTVGGQSVDFWFHTQGGTTTNQLLSLCANNGFSTTVALADQNNIVGNGFNVGLGCGGGDCTTENICISVTNVGPTQYIPSGSYLNSSSNVSVTLTALCQANSTPTSVTYNSTSVANIGDIANDNGTLTLVSGRDSTPNNDNKYGPFVPAGSYQNSCSGISVSISADCENSTGGTNPSTTVTYSQSQAANITDITNNNGTLTIITS